MSAITPPNGKPTLKTTVQTLDTVRDALLEAKRIHRTWRRVSIVLYACVIPAGTLSAIAKGRDPKKPQYRHLLGLPALIEVAACDKCGEGHVLGECIRGKQVVIADAGSQVKITKPRKPSAQPRPPRISIRLDNAPSAARTIITHMGPDTLATLIDLLSAPRKDTP